MQKSNHLHNVEHVVQSMFQIMLIIFLSTNHTTLILSSLKKELWWGGGGGGGRRSDWKKKVSRYSLYTIIHKISSS